MLELLLLLALGAYKLNADLELAELEPLLVLTLAGMSVAWGWSGILVPTGAESASAVAAVEEAIAAGAEEGAMATAAAGMAVSSSKGMNTGAAAVS